ncbi:MAG: phosphatidylserine decarboxylase [Verrucomicrobiae bacterium]|nr:phosphatidylserine decarboxylase [Verrucomicrobiae bacterium]
MRRDFKPSPLKLAMPLLRWLVFLMIVGAFGRWWALFWPCLALFLFHAAFHRNPRRPLPEDPKLLIAPADGKITDITEMDEPKFLKGKCIRVGIFLSVFDVHVQPSPCDGALRFVEYLPGQFLDARNRDASARNESQLLGLETPDGIRIMVKQISGAIARRIILWRLLNEEVKRGELLGMIRYGSRVELFLPAGFAEILVKEGDHVYGCKTPIARRKK